MWNVYLRSVPGFFEQYEGKVTVWADTEESAISAAFQKLKRTSFPDRDRSLWRVERVEKVWQAGVYY